VPRGVLIVWPTVRSRVSVPTEYRSVPSRTYTRNGCVAEGRSSQGHRQLEHSDTLRLGAIDEVVDAELPSFDFGCIHGLCGSVVAPWRWLCVGLWRLNTLVERQDDAHFITAHPLRSMLGLSSEYCHCDIRPSAFRNRSAANVHLPTLRRGVFEFTLHAIARSARRELRTRALEQQHAQWRQCARRSARLRGTSRVDAVVARGRPRRFHNH
jgi:hypothetical protein